MNSLDGVMVIGLTGQTGAGKVRFPRSLYRMAFGSLMQMLFLVMWLHVVPIVWLICRNALPMRS